MIYYLSLGSNKGDRGGYLQKAFGELEKIGRITRRSSLYETEAQGPTGQGLFLNAACVFKSALRPLRLLRKLKQIEARLGRQRNIRWGAREIDIDIIDWNGKALSLPVLTIPHVMLKQRAFVLQPLAEAAPEFVSRDGDSITKLLNAVENTNQLYVNKSR